MVKVKVKPTLTDREGPQNCEASRLSHFPESRLTDNSEVFSVTHQPAFNPQDHSAAGKIRWNENSNDLIWNRTCGFQLWNYTVKYPCLGNVQNRTHVRILLYTFCLEWLVLWSPRILMLLLETFCMEGLSANLHTLIYLFIYPRSKKLR